MTRLWLGALVACHSSTPTSVPTSAVIDRFSDHAGHLMVRAASNHLPAAGAPIDFDQPPFVTQGLGPDGSVVRYYNFDVQDPTPGTRFRFVHAGTKDPIAGQLDVIDTVPGEPAYSDFWLLATVEVPPDFKPGSITSASQIAERKLAVTAGSTALDCPIVPAGSTARSRIGNEAVAPDELWYRGQHVSCLHFGAPLTVDGDGHVPTSPIYVTFAGVGPASGFRTEGTAQTHNVVFSLPGDADYSPLWAVRIYPATAFDQVHDAESAEHTKPVKLGPLVNCPIISVTPK